jgi:hypothetical protein
MTLIVVSVAIAAVALVIGYAQRKKFGVTQPADSLARAKKARPWIVALVLLAFEMAGVFGSFYITQAVLKPGQNVVLLSLLVAAANFAGTLTARNLTAPLTPIDAFLFFKDGLLWPAALPTLAKSMGL